MLTQIQNQYFSDKINYIRLLVPLLSSIAVMLPCAEPTYQETVLSRQAMAGIWFTSLTILGMLWVRGYTLADGTMKRWIDGINIALVLSFCSWAILYRCRNDKSGAFIATLISWIITFGLLVTYIKIDYLTSLFMASFAAWMVLVLINSYADSQIPSYGWNS